jgi:hypothetical protein
MNAPLHDDTFSFAPGGIVAFANPEDEKKQQVEDPQYKPLPPKAESTAGMLFNALGLDKVQNFLTENAAQNNMTDQAENQTPGVFEKLTPAQRQAKLDVMNSTLSGATQGLQPRVVTDPAEMAKLEAARTGQPISTAPAGIPGQPISTAPAGIPGIVAAVGNLPEGKPNQYPSMVNDPRLLGPAPLPNPMPTKPSGGIAQLTTPTAPKITQDTEEAKALKTAQTNYTTWVNKLQNEYSKKDLTPDEIAADMLKEEQRYGVGKYDEWAKKQYETNEKRHAERAKSRGMQDAFAQLSAYARPGANWSKVMDTDIINKAAHLASDEDFENKQQVFMDSIMKTAEAKAQGSSKELHARILDQSAKKHDLLKNIMDSQKVPYEMAEKILANKMQVDEQHFGHQAQEKVGMANAAASMKNANSRQELASLQLESQRQKLANESQKVQIQFQGVLNKNPEYIGIAKIKQRLESQLSATQDEVKQEEIKTKISEQDAKIIEVTNKILGGGIKSQLPATGSNVPPRPADAVKLMPK